MSGLGEAVPRELAHLRPEAAAMVGRSIAERIWFAQTDKWISTPVSDAAAKAIKETLHQPPQKRRRGLLILGRTNAGKSALLSHMHERYPATLVDGVATVPLPRVDIPLKGDMADLYGEMLFTLGIPHSPRSTAREKRQTLLDVIAEAPLLGVLVDEANNALLGSPAQQAEVLGFLRTISNKIRAPLVLAGTDEVLNAVRTELQVGTRYQVHELPDWRLDLDFRKLLKTVEGMLPLAEPSSLDGPDLAREVHAKCGGTIGGVIDVLKDATAVALRGGKERIDLDVLRQVDAVTAADYRLRRTA